jgi:hypothetical protein
VSQQLTKRQIQESLRLARGIGDEEDTAHWEAELENIKQREVRANG